MAPASPTPGKPRCWSRSCAATMHATWTSRKVLGLVFRSRAPLRSPMVESCPCTTATRMGLSCAWRSRCACTGGAGPRDGRHQRTNRIQLVQWAQSAARAASIQRRSRRERWTFDVLVLEERDRLEAIVAGMAVPEIDRAVLLLLDPFRQGDRRATLGTRIVLGHVAKTRAGHSACHGVFPCGVSCFTSKWDSMIAARSGSAKRDGNIGEQQWTPV